MIGLISEKLEEIFMKMLLLTIITFGSFTVFAQEIAVINYPQVNGRYLQVNSDADKVCEKLGFSAALEGSKKVSPIFSEQRQCDDILKVQSDGSMKTYFCKVRKITEITCY